MYGHSCDVHNRGTDWADVPEPTVIMTFVEKVSLHKSKILLLYMSWRKGTFESNDSYVAHTIFTKLKKEPSWKVLPATLALQQ